VIDVHTDADDHVLHQVNFGLDLGEDSAELFTVNKQVIRPLDIDIQSRVTLTSIVHGDGRS